MFGGQNMRLKLGVSMPSMTDEIISNVEKFKELEKIKLNKPKQTRVICVASQKGGVGKTTTTVNIGNALALKGMRVLIIDFDPQSNTTSALNAKVEGNNKTTYEVLIGNENINDSILHSSTIENLDILPASIDLSAAEIELSEMDDKYRKLEESINTLDNDHIYDYILIDTPPSLGLLSINALVACKYVLIPVQSEYYALEGLSLLLDTIDKVKTGIDSEIFDPFFIVTMYDSRTTLSKDVLAEISQQFYSKLIKPVIPRSVRVSEAPSQSMSVIEHDKTSIGSISYIEAAINLSKKIEQL